MSEKSTVAAAIVGSVVGSFIFLTGISYLLILFGYVTPVGAVVVPLVAILAGFFAGKRIRLPRMKGIPFQFPDTWPLKVTEAARIMESLAWLLIVAALAGAMAWVIHTKYLARYLAGDERNNLPVYCTSDTFLEELVASSRHTLDKARILELRCKGARFTIDKCTNTEGGYVFILVHCSSVPRLWDELEIAHQLIWLECRFVRTANYGWMSVVYIETPTQRRSSLWVPGENVCSGPAPI